MKSIIAALMLLTGTILLPAKSIDELLSSGHYREADLQLLQLYKGNPDSHEYLLLMGRTAVSGENSATSLKDYINKNPENAILTNWARLLLGKYYLSQGLYVTAGRQFESIDADSPFFQEADYLAARCLLRSGETQDAIAAFESFLEGQKQHGTPGQSEDRFWQGWASLGLADAYVDAGENHRAEDTYERLLDPDHKETVMAPAIMALAGLADARSDAKMAAIYNSMYGERFGAAIVAPPAAGSVEPPAQSPPVVPKKAKKHYIQVGVYSKRDNALKISSLYRKSGYDVYMENFEKEGKEFYRILIGGYDSKQQAEFIKNRLEKATDEKYILLER